MDAARLPLVAVWAVIVACLNLLPPGVEGRCNATTSFVLPAGYIASDGTFIPPFADTFALVPPTDPGLYDPNSHCEWFITPQLDVVQAFYSNQTFLSISFYLLNLKADDTLRVFHNGSLAAQYTAGSSPDTLYLYGQANDQLRIVFDSGPTTPTTGQGFGLYFQTGSCMFGIAKYSSPGSVASGNVDVDNTSLITSYPLTTDCGFLIQTNGSAIIDWKITLNIESGYDFVLLYDGADSTAQLVRPLSGPGIFGSFDTYSFTSSSSSLYWEFQSDKTIAYSGWKAEWTFISSASCIPQTNLTDSGLITDGSGVGNFSSSSDCTWNIDATAGANAIRLYFSELDVGAGTVNILTPNGTQVASLSGSLPPKAMPIYYTGNALKVQFLANGAAAPGFAFGYHAGSCSARVTVLAENFVIDDGSGDNTYIDNNLCQWLVDLRGISGVQNIAFTLPVVDLEYRFDVLSVYDGLTIRAPQLLAVTGRTKILEPITSSGPVMLVVFKTDQTIGGQGWNLQYSAQYESDSSSDDTVTIISIVVPVGVGALLLLAFICCFLVLAILWFLARQRPRRKVYVEPDYSEIMYETVVPVLKPEFSNEILALEDMDYESNVSVYSRFEQLLLNVEIAHALDVAARDRKDELDVVALSHNLLLIYVFNGHASDILASETRKELKQNMQKGTTKAATLWRESSAVTAMFALYAKIISVQYIWKTLVVVLEDIKDLAEQDKEGNQAHGGPKMEAYGLELDPRRLSAQENALVNRLQLELMSQRLLNAIITSLPYFPEELRKFFYDLREEISSHVSTLYSDLKEKKIDKKIKQEYHKAAASFLFLRMFSPAIVAPHLYGIYKEKPDKELQRFLVLISKVLQNLSNGVYFRENYMENMNNFISKNLPTIHQYFDELPERSGSTISHISRSGSSISATSEISAKANVISIFELESKSNTSSTDHTDQSESDIEEFAAPREMSTLHVPLFFRQNKKFTKAARVKALQNLRLYAIATAAEVDTRLSTSLRNPDKKKLRKNYAEVVSQLRKEPSSNEGRSPGLRRRKSSSSLQLSETSTPTRATTDSPAGGRRSGFNLLGRLSKKHKQPQNGGSNLGKKVALMEIELTSDDSYTPTDPPSGTEDDEGDDIKD